jgi:ribosomal protein L24
MQVGDNVKIKIGQHKGKQGQIIVMNGIFNIIVRILRKVHSNPDKYVSLDIHCCAGDLEVVNAIK